METALVPEVRLTQAQFWDWLASIPDFGFGSLRARPRQDRRDSARRLAPRGDREQPPPNSLVACPCAVIASPSVGASRSVGSVGADSLAPARRTSSLPIRGRSPPFDCDDVDLTLILPDVEENPPIADALAEGCALVRENLYVARLRVRGELPDRFEEAVTLVSKVRARAPFGRARRLRRST